MKNKIEINDTIVCVDGFLKGKNGVVTAIDLKKSVFTHKVLFQRYGHHVWMKITDIKKI